MLTPASMGRGLGAIGLGEEEDIFRIPQIGVDVWLACVTLASVALCRVRALLPRDG